MAKKNNPTKYVSKRVTISSDIKVTMSVNVRLNLCKYYIEKIVVNAKKTALRDEIKSTEKAIEAIDGQIKALSVFPIDNDDLETRDATNRLIQKFKSSKRELASNVELLNFKISKLSNCKLDNTVIDLEKDANIKMYQEYCKLCNGGKNTLASKTDAVLKTWGIELTDAKLAEFMQLVNGINSKVVLDTTRLTKAMPYKKYMVRFFDTMIDFMVSFNKTLIESVTNDIKKIIEEKVDMLTIEDYLKTLVE